MAYNFQQDRHIPLITDQDQCVWQQNFHHQTYVRRWKYIHYHHPAKNTVVIRIANTDKKKELHDYKTGLSIIHVIK